MAAPRGGSIALLVGAVTCAGLGGYFALQEFGGGPEARTLGLAATLERERAVRIEGFSAVEAAWLEFGYRERGIEVTDAEDAPRIARFDATDPMALRLAEASDLWPLGGSAFVHTCEDPEAPGRLATFLIVDPQAGAEELDESFGILGRALPPTRSGTRQWTAPIHFDLPEDWPRPGDRLEVAARELRRILGIEDDREVHSGAEYPLDFRATGGAIDASGWFLPHGGVLGTTFSAEGSSAEGEDQALRAYARWLLLGELGPPADLWFADGVVEDALRSLPDRSSSAEGGSPLDVTFEEAIGREPRTRVARLASIAMLARLAAPDVARRRAVWRDGLDGAALDALRKEWDRVRAAAAAEADAAADGGEDGAGAGGRRRLPRTVAVRLTGTDSPPLGYGTKSVDDQLERLADLGFGAVVLTVHVPIAPPSKDDPRRALELGGWGRFATTDGDGAVLFTARRARDLGLDVVLWPRFVAGPGGSVAHQQTHPDPPSIEEFGRRYALAVEGVAHLAERAGAVGLVLFEPELLPRPASVPEDVRLAYAGFRRQAIAFARPFRGELLALGRGRPRLERASQMTELAPGSGITLGFDLGTLGADVNRPWSAYERRLRSILGATDGRVNTVEVALGGRDPERRDNLLRAAAQALGAVTEIDFVILSHWALDRGEEDPSRFDVSAAPEDVLRGLANVRR